VAVRLMDLRWNEDPWFRAAIMHELDRKHLSPEELVRLALEPEVFARELVGDPSQLMFALPHHGTTAPTAEPIRPPRAERVAENCVLRLLGGEKGEALLGDLRECFEDDCKRCGPALAQWLYGARTLKSLIPLVRRAAVRAINHGTFFDAKRRL
jgi:hypothetical protein